MLYGLKLLLVEYNLIWENQLIPKRNVIAILPTEHAPAERTDPAMLLRQHKDWVKQEQTRLIGDAVPNVVLVVNSTRQIVYANSQVKQFGKYTSPETYIGLATRGIN